MEQDIITIGIIPTGNVWGQFLKDIIDGISESLNKVYNSHMEKMNVVCKLIPDRPLAIPATAYDETVGKYRTEPFFNLAAHIKNLADKKLKGNEKKIDKVVVLTDVNIFRHSKNFIFGEAEIGGSIAVVSISKLNSHSNRFVFKERVVKECVHEIGHTLGLGHCENDRCVMSQSVDHFDVDKKTKYFCSQCSKALENGGSKEYRTWDGR
ncbi:MAG: hypothetical protein ACXQTP_01495 [Candidatus Methanofastidiosia archaeon]